MIIVLVVVNVAALIFILSGPKPGLDNKFDRRVVDKLDLNAEQIRKFNIMKREHHQDILQIDDDMQVVYERYFYLLADPADSSKKDSLENILSRKQKDKIQITYKHFDDLKRLCSKEQQEKFKELVPLLMNVINQKKNPVPTRRN